MIPFQDVSAFHFEWPWALLGLLLLPVWWRLYLGYQKKKWQQALEFSYTAVAAQLKHQPAAWKRILLPVTAMLIMGCLVLALARPTVIAKVPTRSVDIMLVMDISLSMLAEDMRPDRMTAAREAAIRFVEQLPRDIRIGLEFFAGDNYVLSPPTDNHGEIVAYLRNLRKEDLKMRTAIGSALRTAMVVLASDDPVEERLQEPEDSPDTKPAGETGERKSSQPVPKKPDEVIVLLSDGDSKEGYPWSTAALEAKAAGILIHTIGVGSPNATTITYQGMELPVSFDETTLRRIAELAGGNYFRVFKESDFRRVYDQIEQRSIHYQEESIDLGFMLAGLALLLGLGATVLAARLGL